tara:strand:+ start:627 stop:842 length:216 start_codon:yes stop_codon:yes gene_type:complete
MPSKDYEHYRLLSSEDLISMIEKKDSDIKTLQKNLKDTKELKEKYYAYNQFHIEEISRLDQEIGKLKGLRG